MSKERKSAHVASGPSGLSRRDLLKAGLVAGVGATSLGATQTSQAQDIDSTGELDWDYEADVVVVGSGSVGLVAAVRARDLGASVIVIEQNHDAGGKLAHSGGRVSLGGGDAIQERDRAGADPDGFGLTAPLVSPEDLDDNPDLLFKDVTDWSVVENSGVAPYRLNDREQHRAWADNTVATRQFLMDNYVRFARIPDTHEGGGMSRARAPRSMLKLAETTDIKAGTVSREDAGSGEEERTGFFNPRTGNPAPMATSVGAPGWIHGGFAMARGLEFAAREKGVQFFFNRHLDSVVRGEQFSGPILGVEASYTPRLHPDTNEPLGSYWQNGNVDETAPVIRIRARKGVIIGSGGFYGNKVLRMMVDPRLSDDSFQYGDGLMGPLHEDGSGIVAGLRVGAGLAGMMQGYHSRLGSPGLKSLLGTSAAWEAVYPGHPAFLFIKSKGVEIGSSGWEHVITVNQVGQRFFNETAIADSIPAGAAYPPGSSGTRTPFTPTDWRNTSVEHINTTMTRTAAVDAALAMNEGSKPPHYSSGPVWAIFDADAAERGGWPLRYPYIAEPSNGYFIQADTLAELAQKVMDNPHQTMPLKYLEETVARYNSFAETGVDEDFEKPVMHKLQTPPFYAAIVPVCVNDSYGGLRINGNCEVTDLQGEVIPGLYAGGEASGGGRMHGIGRAAVHGYIAASHAAVKQVE
ncbi:FAD-dependent oxidoreductase [Pelagibacterium sp.]|uniref:FAD-dependent oxidoreductase n=1 Tax=Pelagibacterium sp. TaxID=1967288 RepID=UPI003A901329